MEVLGMDVATFLMEQQVRQLGYEGIVAVNLYSSTKIRNNNSQTIEKGLMNKQWKF